MFGLGGKSFMPDSDIPDLSGKVILVTGGNTGLGKASILELAKHNPAQIYLAARTASKAEAAIKDIKQAVPSANVTFLNLDLTSFKSISEAAHEFNTKSQRLDILMNNAGIMATPPGTTLEGYEIQFGTNHMGHALLTKLLLPTLLSTAKEPNSDVRILNLTSDGHRFARSGMVYDTAKSNAMGTWTRYGNSKLANILYSRELASHHPSITSVSVHPGIIKTDLYDSFTGGNALLKAGMSLFSPFFMGSVAEGAKNQLWCAACKKGDLKNGGYYRPIGSLSSGSGFAHNNEQAKTLWEWTEKELVEKGY